MKIYLAQNEWWIENKKFHVHLSKRFSWGFELGFKSEVSPCLWRFRIIVYKLEFSFGRYHKDYVKYSLNLSERINRENAKKYGWRVIKL